MNKIKIIALMGKAGAGKDYLLQELIKGNKNEYNEIISCTTRPPREGEVNGKNYYFLTEEEFKQQNMIESTEFRGWHYGTSIESLDKEKVNVGVFNPAGVRSLIANSSVIVKPYWVQAEDKTRLLRQLNREENPDVQEIIRRWQTDEEDFANIDFPFTIYWND